MRKPVVMVTRDMFSVIPSEEESYYHNQKIVKNCYSK